MPPSYARPIRLPATSSWGSQLRRLTDGVVGAGLAALVYGSWAAYANASAGFAVALKVALTHGLMSASLTYFGTAWMRGCFRRGATPRAGAIYAFVGGLALTYGLLVSIHTLIGTPHLLLTLAAGVVPNLLFCGAYALLLSRTGLAPAHS